MKSYVIEDPMLNEMGIVYSYRAENDIGNKTFDWRLSEGGFMCMNMCVLCVGYYGLHISYKLVTTHIIYKLVI